MDLLSHRKCEEHPDALPKYSGRFQAYYCPICRAWLSPRCARPYCQYCLERPDEAPVEDYSL